MPGNTFNCDYPCLIINDSINNNNNNIQNDLLNHNHNYNSHTYRNFENPFINPFLYNNKSNNLIEAENLNQSFTCNNMSMLTSVHQEAFNYNTNSIYYPQEVYKGVNSLSNFPCQNFDNNNVNENKAVNLDNVADKIYNSKSSWNNYSFTNPSEVVNPCGGRVYSGSSTYLEHTYDLYNNNKEENTKNCIRNSSDYKLQQTNSYATINLNSPYNINISNILPPHFVQTSHIPNSNKLIPDDYIPYKNNKAYPPSLSTYYSNRSSFWNIPTAEADTTNLSSNNIFSAYLISENTKNPPDLFGNNFNSNNLDEKLYFGFNSNAQIIRQRNTNFSEIILRIENCLIEFLLELESDEELPPKILVINLDKTAAFDYDSGYYALPSDLSDEHFSSLCLAKNLDRITKIMSVMSFLYVKISQNCTSTKREIYYNDVELFRGVASVDGILEDVCSILNFNRFQLGLFPAQKGLFAGIFEIYDSNNNLLALNTAQNYSKINLISSNYFDDFIIFTPAKFILIVEKETIFNNLISNEIFIREFPHFILVTGKGYSDYLTRLFIKRLTLLKPEMRLFYFGDLDPYGIEIYLNYLFGSKSSARENSLIAINNIYWLGLSFELIENSLFSQSIFSDKNSLIELTIEDCRKIDKIFDNKKDVFSIEEWGTCSNANKNLIVANLMKVIDQLRLMLEKKYRAEAEIIVSKHINILVDAILNSDYYRLDVINL